MEEIKQLIEKAKKEKPLAIIGTKTVYEFETYEDVLHLLSLIAEKAHNQGWEDNFHEQSEQDKASLVFVDREIRLPKSYFKTYWKQFTDNLKP